MQEELNRISTGLGIIEEEKELSDEEKKGSEKKDSDKK